jgi:hypothetical protein
MRKYREIVPLLVCVCLLSLVATSAHANAILNPSFEAGGFVNQGNQTMTMAVGSTTITSWTVVGDVMAWINAGNPWSLSAEDGDKFLDLSDYTAGSPFGGVTQTIATTVGSDYVLSYYLGSLTSIWGGPPVSILATAGSTSQTCTDSTTSVVSTWTLCSMSFTATSALTAITLAGAQGVNYIGLDNVSVEPDGVVAPPVPEPASMLLLAIGGVGLLTTARRGRRQQLR